jgi:hypothetical protein
MSARAELDAAVADYKAWRAAGGVRGGENDRRKRIHISGLMEEAQKERAREEVITLDDETENEIDPFEEEHHARDAA